MPSSLLQIRVAAQHDKQMKSWRHWSGNRSDPFERSSGPLEECLLWSEDLVRILLCVMQHSVWPARLSTKRPVNRLKAAVPALREEPHTRHQWGHHHDSPLSHTPPRAVLPVCRQQSRAGSHPSPESGFVQSRLLFHQLWNQPHRLGVTTE